MSESNALETAQPGDVLQGAELQQSIDQLREMANAMNELLRTETEVDAIQAIARAQQRLRSQARDLIVAQIDLIVGEAKITAAHINAAVEYANGVISKIAEWHKRVEQIGAVLDFLAVVSTGNGGQILKAAVKLKSSLDQA
ncbi:MAG TPA: hypothetical protein VFB54_11420 [Burkholderiales bacterium]|nr:hypothetical protein [Burkholderiales bacterium]